MGGLTSVADALAMVLDGVLPLEAETVALAQADGRTLAADLRATRSQPPAAVSSMDGYAVRAADLPGQLRVVGESAAGRPSALAITPGTAMRIFTGGELPAGADAVVMQERAAREGDQVTIPVATAPGQFIRPEGLDFAEGMTGLAAGTRLDPRAIALAAAMNHPVVPVRRRPRVAILSTGDELVPPGQRPGPGQIVSSNALAIAALVCREGGVPDDRGIVPDRLDATLSAVLKARDDGADVLVTSGGASVGEYDLMRDVLDRIGARLGFWKIAMRPGKPLMMADLGRTRLVGLPGNPVASFVCSLLFLAPLLRRLSGAAAIETPIEPAVLGCDLPANDLRADYLRARLSVVGDRLVATPFPVQDSSMIRTLAEADALVLREPFAAPARSGDACRIIRLPR